MVEAPTWSQCRWHYTWGDIQRLHRGSGHVPPSQLISWAQVPHRVLRKKTPGDTHSSVEGPKPGCVIAWELFSEQDPPSKWTQSQQNPMGVLGVLNGETAGKERMLPSISMVGSWMGTLPASVETRPSPHTSAHFITPCLQLSPLSHLCPETFFLLSPEAKGRGETLELHLSQEIRYLKVSLRPSTAGFRSWVLVTKAHGGWVFSREKTCAIRLIFHTLNLELLWKQYSWSPLVPLFQSLTPVSLLQWKIKVLCPRTAQKKFWASPPSIRNLSATLGSTQALFARLRKWILPYLHHCWNCVRCI